MNEWPKMQASMEAQTPTNKHAATRPYCAKHSRAKIDIGGEKQCPACRDIPKRLFCEDGLHCDSMAELLDASDGNRRGFNEVSTINITTQVFRYIGVRYCKTGKRTDRGVMLNFCPMCGASIAWWARERDRSEG